MEEEKRILMDTTFYHLCYKLDDASAKYNFHKVLILTKASSVLHNQITYKFILRKTSNSDILRRNADTA